MQQYQMTQMQQTQMQIRAQSVLIVQWSFFWKRGPLVNFRGYIQGG